jgi:hypothetical protein
MLMLFVKRIVSSRQSILEIMHITLGMQLLPWPGANAAFAALEREEQAVESGGELVDGPVGESAVAVVEVVELVGVVLMQSV